MKKATAILLLATIPTLWGILLAVLVANGVSFLGAAADVNTSGSFSIAASIFAFVIGFFQACIFEVVIGFFAIVIFGFIKSRK